MLSIMIRSLLVVGLLAVAACSDGGDTSGKQKEKSEQDAYVDRMSEEHADDSAESSGMAEMAEAAVIDPMATLSETVEYATVNGKPVEGYLAYPENAHGGLPGILVFHEWWGLNEHIRQMADRLAAQGYVVLAVDLYSGRVAETPERARELMQEVMDKQGLVNDNINQAYKFITEEIGALSVASIGWCLGGTMSFNTALLYPEQLDATVIYYGFVTDVSRAQLAGLEMPILGFFGAEDQGIPVEGVQAFRDTLGDLGKDADITIYEGAGHAFANPTGDNFQPEIAEESWQKTLKFLDRSLNATVNRNVIDEDEIPAEPAEEQ